MSFDLATLSPDASVAFSNNEFLEPLFVIKRQKNSQKFSIDKIKNICKWATNNNDDYVKKILQNFKPKLYNNIKTSELFDLLIRTCANQISPIYTDFEYITAKFLLLKMYKETWIQKIHDGKLNYPDLMSVINKGIKTGRYNPDVFNKYSTSEINELNDYIKQDRDYLFTYKSLYFFYSKYCFRDKENKKFELPQNAYMRVAMVLFVNEQTDIRLSLVKRMYDALSLHEVTVATPIMINSGTKNQQLSSCVLTVMNDDTDSIMDTCKDLAVYSKYKGGTALDVSYLRSSGSYIIGNNGFSSGPIPFLKIVEAIMKGFNQGSERPGACCVYFNWWHWNVKELVVLKNNNGTEENRARFLKYGVKINQLFIDRVLKDEYISLFNPKDVPELLNTFGEEFNNFYKKYEDNPDIQKVVIKARDLMGLILKERAETGNIYLFHIENVNQSSLLNRYINSSNLCTEITLPSSFSRNFNETLNISDKMITKTTKTGEIALCNLASINLVEWDKMDEKQKQELTDIVVRGLDNTIDIANYPVLEAKYSNLQYRFLGIGVSNYANYLATKQTVIDEENALDLTRDVFEELSYLLIKSSMELAKIKGKFSKFDETEWAKGILPIDKANKLALNLTKKQPNYEKWNALRHDIKLYGLRNATIMAIAPTATTGKSINATECTEPIQQLFYKEDGIINIPTLAPELKKNRKYYKKAVECDQYMLLKLAAIRQCYIDQSQSVNIYFSKITSATEFMMLHLFGFSLGMKTFYYCKTEKEVSDVCESCS